MKRYIPYEVDFNCKVAGDKETIRVQAVMLEHPEGPYVNFADVEELTNKLQMMKDESLLFQVNVGLARDLKKAIAERDAAVDLANDAVDGLRYIRQVYGELYGVGFDRVFQKAAAIDAARGEK